MRERTHINTDTHKDTHINTHRHTQYRENTTGDVEQSTHDELSAERRTPGLATVVKPKQISSVALKS